MSSQPRRWLGLGIDVLEVTRMERFIKNHRTRLNRIFHSHEIRWAGAASKRRSRVRYAALFAAKEAVFKSLGIAPLFFMRWLEIDLRPGPKAGSFRAVLGDSLDIPENQIISRIESYWCRAKDHVIAVAARVA